MTLDHSRNSETVNSKKKINKTEKKIREATMNDACICDNSSELTEEKNEENNKEWLQCNRIFLNFTRDFRPSPKDSYKIAKVKDLFKCLSERQDVQEMKVSGWTEERKQEDEEEEEDLGEEEQDFEKNSLGSYCGSTSSAKRGGQRFAMSRDFWYRKLNILKAQKLDEVALEAKDLPAGECHKREEPTKLYKMESMFSSEVPEKQEDVTEQINLFNETVAKPVERQLRKRFVNVYDNRKYFTRKCN